MKELDMKKIEITLDSLRKNNMEGDIYSQRLIDDILNKYFNILRTEFNIESKDKEIIEISESYCKEKLNQTQESKEEVVKN